MTQIGIVGCGAIGKALIQAAHSGKLSTPIAGVTSRSEGSARDFLGSLKNPPPYRSLEDLIGRADLVVEAAGGGIVAELAKRVFAAKKDLMVISVGALPYSCNLGVRNEEGSVVGAGNSCGNPSLILMLGGGGSHPVMGVTGPVLAGSVYVHEVIKPGALPATAVTMKVLRGSNAMP